MNVSINRLTNANLYVDGLGLLGRVEEVTVPQPRALMAEHKGLGMMGAAEFPAGLEKLEARIKWASLYQDSLALISSPYQAHQFQVRANLENYLSQGLASELPVVYLMTGVVKDPGEFVFHPHENVGSATAVTVYHSELYVAGVQIFLYDVMANMYVVGSADQLANFRANIGG